MSRDGVRRAVGSLLLVVLGASAVYGGGFFGVRDRFAPPATRISHSAFEAVDPHARPARVGYRRSQPYWRPVTRFDGSGSRTTPPFTVSRAAIQWRVRWRCDRGSLRIQPERPSGKAYGHRLAQTEGCPQEGTGLSVAQDDFRLAVRAQGAWTARVEEQVDVPLIEAPTAQMRSRDSLVLGSGRFYGVDEDGEGRVRIFRHADDSVSLRLEDFHVTPNVDLEIRFSELPRPETTRQVEEAPYEDVVFLKATSGEMNYRIPPGKFTARVRSVVIWCEITRNAYAAAALRR